MARLRFGDQSVPRVTRVATGGGGGTIGGMSDVDLTDTSQGGLAEGSVLVRRLPHLFATVLAAPARCEAWSRGI